MNIVVRALSVCCLAAVPSFFAGASSSAQANEWHFKATLDGKQIGYHRFAVNDRASDKELTSEARFTVKLLFITAYRYEHDSRELWRDGCLHRIDARTDDNGKRNAVSGSQDAAHFKVVVGASSAELDACVLTFAYWNPQILKENRLLNPQTGEHVPVKIERVGTEMLSVRGVERAAERYRLLGDAKIGGKLVIDLWYADKNWLALESTTEDGRLLRYQLQ